MISGPRLDSTRSCGQPCDSALPRIIQHSIIVCLALMMLTGCTQRTRDIERRAPLWQSTIIDGELWVQAFNGERHKLQIEGQNYHPLPSPDGRWLAVEVQRLSNLRTLRIFEHTTNGPRETAINASSHLWQRARDADGVDTDNLRYPAIRVVRWHPSSHALDVELRGETSDDAPYVKTLTLRIDTLIK
jgi:hypothetical protein